MSFFKDNVTSG